MGNTILKSTEYDKFDVETNKLMGNRSLNKSHIRKLAESINENAESLAYNPIIVNDQFQIIDGQHRFEAVKELGLPIYYVVWEGADIEDAQRLNASSKNWSPLDYAFSYSQQGNKNYGTYLNFRERWGLNHDVLIQYLSLEEPVTNSMFKSGKFKAVNPARTDELCSALEDLGEFWDKYKHRSFALAFKNIWLNPYGKYNHERMLRQMKKYGKRFLQDNSAPTDAERMFENIYNYGYSVKTRLS